MHNNLVLGKKPVMEILEEKPDHVDLVLIKKPVPPGLDPVLSRCRQLHVRFKLVPDQELQKMGAARQGIAARLRAHTLIDLDLLLKSTTEAELPVLLLLDQVQDSGNLGTLARTLAALGGAGIIIPRDRTAPLGPGAMKASAGALTRIGISQVTNLARTLDHIGRKGFNIYAATMNQGQSVLKQTFAFPAVMVLGGEEKGIRPNVLKRCPYKIHIPMAGSVDSLNVAQAGALILGRMMSSG
ncbi:23S rRNA (guanosine(2251)-2'-O)-methyltransferase RlmB [Desulfonatronospira sp.]|uniref:23S rRNA (guanosine(2251)-2'-O)-methyltransferase RlmB n=1 Tax=Desulfonatronospira sp. TaxID=1962951 RepID=UPI0025C2D52B|nr:23S rRNA (guanosine(2251)-2'-O)-methyltransferase RlmB [Desulfonatronospira sp.]